MDETLSRSDRFDHDGSVDICTAKQLFDCRIFGTHKERDTEATGQKNEFWHCVIKGGITEEAKL